MKVKYAEHIIDLINKKYNGKIIEFTDRLGLLTKWAVQVNNYILIFTEYSLENDFLSSQEILNLQSSGCVIVPIYIEDVINKDKLISPKSVVINAEEKKVYYGDEEIESIVNIITRCIPETSQSKNVNNIGPVTMILILINAAAYLVTAYRSGNFIDADINVLVALGAKYNPLIKAGQYYRLFTCGFLHGGIIHLALNMMALYSIGPMAEKYFGKVKYIIVYMVSLLISSELSYIFSDSVSIGASGAIFGLLGSLLVMGLKYRNKVSRGFVKSIINVIVINLIIGFTIPNIDNYGHLGGLLGGIIVTYILSEKEA